MIKKNRRVSNIFLFITFLLFFVLTFLFFISEGKKEETIKEEQEKQTVAKVTASQEIQEKTTVSFLPLDQEIALSYQGYSVIANLEIPKIKVDTPVLSAFSEAAMKKCVTKLAGSNPNEIGNFCIIGHNYVRKNMFSKLKNLETGDCIYLSDRIHGKLEYRVNGISIVKPEDVSCLKQQNEKYELTLITCTSDSKARVIVKAEPMTK